MITGVFTFDIFMDPIAKGRPRFTKTGHAFTPAKTRTAESAMREEIAKVWKSNVLSGAVFLSIEFFFRKPKSNKTSFHMQRPDCDNLAKSVSDAMNGIVFADDSQVVELRVKKSWDDVGSIRVHVGSVQ